MHKVLIIDDKENILNSYKRALRNDAVVIGATTLEDAELHFAENSDVAIIVMDGCVPGDDLNTIPLINKIRESFKGPMIAASSSSDYRLLMCEAGCDYEVLEKGFVPHKVRELIANTLT